LIKYSDKWEFLEFFLNWEGRFKDGRSSSSISSNNYSFQRNNPIFQQLSLKFEFKSV
jgi:hypothetical protein